MNIESTDLRKSENYSNVFFGDCLIESDKIKDGVVDLILTDLPYGTVTNIASSETWYAK